MTQAVNLANFANNLDSSGGVNPTALNAAVPIAKGGTNATTTSAARTSLGLAIGTDIPSPTGTGASGTWGISISGNAATATSATSATSASTAAFATTAGNGGVTSVNGSTGAVTISTTPTTTQVLNATAGASVGAVGTYAFLSPSFFTTTNVSASWSPGATASGSNLFYASAQGRTGSPLGTWRLMGIAYYSFIDGEGVEIWVGSPTVCLRIS
jgi:hypothetical protein